MSKEIDPRKNTETARGYGLVIHRSVRDIPATTRARFAEENRSIRERTERFGLAYNEHIQKSQQAILTTADRALSRAPQEKEKTALILGSGNCLDIPLAELTDRFDKVTLVEIDHQSTEAAVKKLSPEQQQKTTIIATDITGVVADFAKRMDLHLNRPMQAFLARAPGSVAQFDVTGKGLSVGADYTFVSSQLVMTQVSSLPILSLREKFFKKYGVHLSTQPGGADHELIMALQPKTIGLQQEHIRQLARLVAPSGTVHFADTVTLFKYSPFSKEPKRLPVSNPQFIVPVIGEQFTSPNPQGDAWLWNHEPGKSQFLVMAHSFDPKP